jgi:hypothetical protein
LDKKLWFALAPIILSFGAYEQALIRAGYTVVAKDTYYFNGLSYRKNLGPGRPVDLDFIAKVPSYDNIYAGIQVKNRMEAPKSETINGLIDICRCLRLKPLLVTRIAHPALLTHQYQLPRILLLKIAQCNLYKLLAYQAL